VIDNEVKLTSQMKCLTKIMDVDDDDEYTNVAAAHAAFVITVSGSAARMYWYIMHSTRDINIHKLHSFPEKTAWALPIFYTMEPLT